MPAKPREADVRAFRRAMSHDPRVMNGRETTPDSPGHALALKRLSWAGCAVWAWSWYTMYLEIFRWEHVTRALRFDSTPILGTGIRPKAGRPLKALFVCFYGAPPLAILSAVAAKRIRTRVPDFVA
jgi:hypothetical protein